jgi:hypothetical protein
MLQHAGNAKITDFNLAILRHEYVLSLEIAVQNLAIMNVLNS